VAATLPRAGSHVTPDFEKGAIEAIKGIKKKP